MRKKLSSDTPSAAARRRLSKLTRQSDSTIDFSGIPPLTENFWRNAARNPFYRPIKQQLGVLGGKRDQ